VDERRRARRAVPNILSERPAETRDFFVDLLGFEVAMDMGWVVTLASPTDPSVQVTIGTDDPAAPGISVEVSDRRGLRQGGWLGSRDRLSPSRRGVGSPALHASRAERDDRAGPLPPLRLSGSIYL
jgi:catechol 2,3-dioxygenase-like lactoylglutathione lyase family enzyme